MERLYIEVDESEQGLARRLVPARPAETAARGVRR